MQARGLALEKSVHKTPRGMGYTRIYLVSGGTTFLSAKIGRIQENDGRYKITRPFVERGQRRTKPPMSEPLKQAAEEIGRIRAKS